MLSVVSAPCFPLHSSVVDPSIVLSSSTPSDSHSSSYHSQHKDSDTEQRMTKRQKVSNYDDTDIVLDLTVETDLTMSPEDGRPSQSPIVNSSSSSSSSSVSPPKSVSASKQSQYTNNNSTTNACPICMKQVLKSRLVDHAAACFETMQREYTSNRPALSNATSHGSTNNFETQITSLAPNMLPKPVSQSARQPVFSNQSACAQAEEAAAKACAASSPSRILPEEKIVTTTATLSEQSIYIDVCSSDDSPEAVKGSSRTLESSTVSAPSRNCNLLDEVDTFPMKFMQLDDALAKEMQRIQPSETETSSSTFCSASSSSSSPLSGMSRSFLVSVRSEVRVLYGIHRNEVDALKREISLLRATQNALAEDFTRERLQLEERANGETKQQQEQLSQIRIEEMTRREADTEQLRRTFEQKEQGFKQELKTLSDNKQALMAGEAEAIATGLGELKRIVLKPNRNFDGHTSDEFHFRLAESQFYRMCQKETAALQYHITSVEYILNPPLLKRFHDFKKEASARGDLCEDYITWHGTSGEALDKIVKEGFKIGGVDKGVAVASGAALGHGIYTSESPTFAMGYMRQHSGSRRLLFARVCRTKDSVVQYDGSKVIQQLVSKHKDQVYPQYVVHFAEGKDTKTRSYKARGLNTGPFSAMQSLQNATSALMSWMPSSLPLLPVGSGSAASSMPMVGVVPTGKTRGPLSRGQRKRKSAPAASASPVNTPVQITTNDPSVSSAVIVPPPPLVRRSSRNRRPTTPTIPSSSAAASAGPVPNSPAYAPFSSFAIPLMQTPAPSLSFDPTDPLGINSLPSPDLW